jgi:hypothetical protein
VARAPAEELPGQSIGGLDRFLPRASVALAILLERESSMAKRKIFAFMDKVRVYHDRTGNTVTVWFDDPKKESVCEEIGDDIVLISEASRTRSS